MKRVVWSASPVSIFFFVLAILFAGALPGCSKPAQQAKPAPSHPSEINVEVRDGGPIVVTTKTGKVVIGRLMASSTGPGSPLLWHGGGYRMLAPGQPPAPAIADQDIAVVR